MPRKKPSLQPPAAPGWVPGPALAWKIALAYALVSALWIFLSDHALHAIVTDVAALKRLEILKGWLFVAVTAAMLGFALQRYFARIRAAGTQVQEAGQFASAVVNGLSAHIVVVDGEGDIVACNDAWRRFAAENGLEPEVSLTSELWPPTSVLGPLAGGIREVLAGRRAVFEQEYACHSPQEKRWFIARVTPFQHGSTRRVIIAHENITGRRLQEEALRDSEERFRHTFEQAALGITHVGLDHRWLRVNQRFCDILGYTREEMLQKSWKDFTHPSDLETDLDFMRQLVDGTIADYEFEKRYRRKNGSWVWVRLAVSLVRATASSPAYYVSVVEDIETRREMESALQMQHAALEDALNGFDIVDENGRFAYANRAFLRMWGYDQPEQIIGTSPAGLFENPEVLHQSTTNLLENGEDVREFTARRRDGSTFHASMAAKRFASPDGRVMFMRSSLDITERKQAQERLAASEQKYRRLYESSLDGYATFTLDGRIVEANQVFLDMLGYTGQAVRELRYTDFTPARWRQMEGAIVAEQVIPRGYSEIYQKEYIREDGTVFPAELRTYLIKDEAGTPVGMWAFVRDISQRKQAEGALRRSEGLLRSIIDNAGAIIWVKDLYGRFLLANHYVERVPGVTLNDMLGHTVFDLFPTALAKDYARNDRRALESGRPVEAEETVQLADGDHTFLAVKFPLRDPGGIVYGLGAICTDITERKKAELGGEVLHSLALSLSSITAPVEVARSAFAAADRLWKWDAGTLNIIWPGQDTVETLLSLDIADGERRELRVSHPNLHEATPRMRHVMAQGSELILRTPAEMAQSDSEPFGDKSRLSASLMSVPIHLRGEVVGVLSVQSYIPDAFTKEDVLLLQSIADHCGGTLERLRAEESLRRNEVKFRALIERAPDGIVLVSPQRAITFASPSARRMFGFENIDLAMIDSDALTHPEDLPRVLAALDELLRHPEQVKVLEYRFRHNDGRWIWIESVLCNLIGVPEVDAIVINFRNITERKQAEELLARERWLLRTVIDEIPDAVFLKDLQGRFVVANRAVAQLMGAASPDELLGNTDAGFYPEADAAVFRADEARVFVGEPMLNKDETVSMRNGSQRHLLTTKLPFRAADGAVIGLVGIGRDVTERRKIEQSLLESEQRFRDITYASADWVWEVDVQARFTFASENVKDVLGYTPEEILGRTPFDLMPSDEAERLERQFRELARRRASFRDVDNVNLHKDGSLRHIVTNGVPILGPAGQWRGYRGTAKDVTARKRAELELRQSLAEKTALLKEVHHRVKNNLQIVASLLNLQAGRVQHREAVDVLQDTRNRVHSMALLHEVLYSSDNLAQVNFTVYVDELCTQLLRSFGPAVARVTLEKRVEHVRLPLDQSLPCGLIINELVSNALKHAFPGNRPGRIAVEVRRTTLEEILVRVSDDGVGLPAGLDLASTPTLGLRLITSLVAQLNGRWEIETPGGAGAAFRVMFPAPREKSTEVG